MLFYSIFLSTDHSGCGPTFRGLFLRGDSPPISGVVLCGNYVTIKNSAEAIQTKSLKPCANPTLTVSTEWTDKLVELIMSLNSGIEFRTQAVSSCMSMSCQILTELSGTVCGLECVARAGFFVDDDEVFFQDVD